MQAAVQEIINAVDTKILEHYVTQETSPIQSACIDLLEELRNEIVTIGLGHENGKR